MNETYVWIHDGIVANLITWDGNTDPSTGGLEIPQGDVVTKLLDGQLPYVGLPATQGDDGIWSYASPPPPTLTAAEILARNTATRNALLTQATSAIAPLQDALDLGIIEAAEQTMLTAWKNFRVLVNRVQLTSTDPTWPTPPAPLNYESTNPSS